MQDDVTKLAVEFFDIYSLGQLIVGSCFSLWNVLLKFKVWMICVDDFVVRSDYEFSIYVPMKF